MKQNGMSGKKRLELAASRALLFLAGLACPVEKKVVFNSFFGKQYSCNPRAVSDKMHELYPDYELVWLLKDASDPYGLIPDYVRVVTKGSRRYAWGREIASAAAYVYNIEQGSDIYRKKNQFFVQTWHGDRGVKRILLEMTPKPGELVDVRDDRVTSVCVAGSDFGVELYRKAFGYGGEVLKIGAPRNDRLVKGAAEQAPAIRARLGLPEGKKILLFAPTFRDHQKDIRQPVSVDLTRAIAALNSKGEEWICLMRAHVASSGLQVSEDGHTFFDVSRYGDMADLLCIADMLITDYSSCACDFAITEKAVILALFDEAEYERQCRDFKIRPEQQGFPVAYSQEELEKILTTAKAEDYARACRRVNAFYDTCETGAAAEEICRRIDEFYQQNLGKAHKKAHTHPQGKEE